MRRALRSVLVACLTLDAAACSRSPHGADRPAASACDVAPEAAHGQLIESLATPDWGAKVDAIELSGVRRVPDALVRAALGTRVGSALDEARVAADVRRLYALEVFEQVAVESVATPTGVRLRFVLSERPLVGRVEYRGPRVLPPGRYLPVATGELYDPARVRRAAQGLEDHLIESGHLDARVTSRAKKRGLALDLCFAVLPGPRYVIAELALVGNASVASPTLLERVDDHDGKANRVGAPFRPDLLEPARLHMLALYYDRGFLNVEVGEPHATRNESDKTLRVEWSIREGEVYRVSRLAFSGQLRSPEKRYRELLDLAPGQVFARSALLAGLERIRAHHEKLGRQAEVTPETELDTTAHTLSVSVRIEERRR